MVGEVWQEGTGCEKWWDIREKAYKSLGRKKTAMYR
jgi:hypothetical protein